MVLSVVSGLLYKINHALCRGYNIQHAARAQLHKSHPEIRWNLEAQGKNREKQMFKEKKKGKKRGEG